MGNQIITNCSLFQNSKNVTFSESLTYTENTIFVEGHDDAALILYLINEKNLKISDLSLVVPYPDKGFSGLLKNLDNFFLNSGSGLVKKLLIFTDADSNGCRNKFNSIKSKLDKTKFGFNTKLGLLAKNGTTKIRVGVFVFPNNRSKGILEKLCLKTVKKQKRLLCVENYIKCVKKKRLLETPEIRMDKSRLLIYLAATKNPSIGIGGALQNKELDLNSKEYSNIISLLKELI